ncbi:MAG TPA: phosphotransferase [Terriglobales bacterium]
MIPAAHAVPVERALRAAFGVAACDSIQPLTAGLSPALVYRIEVGGCPYLLRINLNPISDPARWFASMGAAAAAGLGPAVRYTSVDDKISITDFVERKPLPRASALRLLPPMLRAVHTLPPFPPMARFPDYLDAGDAFIGRWRAAGTLPETIAAEIFPAYARLRRAYTREADDLVASHNDLNPGNILFDGTRLWLVDWEAAFLNHRYVDLAVVANFVAATAADEEYLLDAYFGQPATEYQRTRFYLMQQFAHLFYAALLLGMNRRGPQRGFAAPPAYARASSGAPEPQAGAAPTLDLDAPTPAFRDLHDRLWSGEASLASAEAKLEYGRVHLNQLRHNFGTGRFQLALRAQRR